jgi:hypothetical protein
MRDDRLSGQLYRALFIILIVASPIAAQTTVDFAGTGDGTTDNQAAFMSAAATLNAAGGGTLRIHAGTYAHSGAVTFGTATNVVCDKGAVLKATTDSSAAMILTGSNSGIQGCRFISSAATLASGNNAAAVFFSNCQSCYGSANSIQGSAGDGYAVAGAGSQDIEISGGFVNGVKGNGVSITAGSNTIDVTGIQITGVGVDCVAAISVASDGTQIHDLTVSRNHCLNAVANGIQIAGVLRANVSGNAVTNPGQHGIIVRNFTPTDAFVPDSIDVRDNTIDNQSNTSYYPIGLQATQNSNAIGNTIRNSSGINQWGQSSHLTISNNRLFNINDIAIKLYSGLDHFAVLGNSVFTATSSCIAAVSVSLGVIGGNACWDTRTSGVYNWGIIDIENSHGVCPPNSAGFNTNVYHYGFDANLNPEPSQVTLRNSDSTPAGDGQCSVF